MLRNRFATLSQQQKADIENALQDAYDFDPRDPLYGLSKAQLSGPRLERRAVLRLMAAAGTLSAMHLVPGLAPRRALAQERGGTLQGGWSGVSEIRTLDPARMDQVEQFQITSNVLSGLTHIDGDFVAQPDLAADWSVSDDGTEYTFHLREGVTFHNGDPLTADDVVFTYNRSKDPAQSIHSQVLVNVLGAEAVDPLTVRFKLARPQASFLVKTTERASGRALTIVNRRALDELGEAQYGLTPVGTGPFRVVEHSLGQPVRAGGVRELLRSGAAQARARDRPADRRGRAAGGSAGGGRHPDHRRRAGAGRADRALPVQPRHRRRHGAAARLLRDLHEPLARADAGRRTSTSRSRSCCRSRASRCARRSPARSIATATSRSAISASASRRSARSTRRSVAMYDPAIAEKSQQRFQPDSARELLAAAGYPGRRGHPAAGADAEPRRPPPRPGAGRHHAPRDRRRDPARPGRQHRARRAPRPPRLRPPGAEQRRRLRSRRRPGRLHDHRIEVQRQRARQAKIPLRLFLRGRGRPAGRRAERDPGPGEAGASSCSRPTS